MENILESMNFELEKNVTIDPNISRKISNYYILWYIKLFANP